MDNRFADFFKKVSHFTHTEYQYHPTIQFLNTLLCNFFYGFNNNSIHEKILKSKIPPRTTELISFLNQYKLRYELFNFLLMNDLDETWMLSYCDLLIKHTDPEVRFASLIELVNIARRHNKTSEIIARTRAKLIYMIQKGNPPKQTEKYLGWLFELRRRDLKGMAKHAKISLHQSHSKIIDLYGISNGKELNPSEIALLTWCEGLKVIEPIFPDIEDSRFIFELIRNCLFLDIAVKPIFFTLCRIDDHVIMPVFIELPQIRNLKEFNNHNISLIIEQFFIMNEPAKKMRFLMLKSLIERSREKNFLNKKELYMFDKPEINLAEIKKILSLSSLPLTVLAKDLIERKYFIDNLSLLEKEIEKKCLEIKKQKNRIMTIRLSNLIYLTERITKKMSFFIRWSNNEIPESKLNNEKLKLHSLSRDYIACVIIRDQIRAEYTRWKQENVKK